jgi:glycine cleavage system aminomethyltransferase T
MGHLPIIDPQTGEVPVDALGRRSFTTSVAFGPSVGKNIALAYLPYDYCQEGRKLKTQYFNEEYPVKIEAVGYRALFDPDHARP